MSILTWFIFDRTSDATILNNGYTNGVSCDCFYSVKILLRWNLRMFVRVKGYLYSLTVCNIEIFYAMLITQTDEMKPFHVLTYFSHSSVARKLRAPFPCFRI